MRRALSLLALLLFAALAQAADEATPTWYAQTLTRGDAGLNVTHFWSKGPMLRAESVVAGHKIVTIVNGKWYYAYDALTGKGLAVKREPAAVAKDRPDRRPFGREHAILVRQGAELVREEKLLGRLAGVYRITDERGRRELWVTSDALRIPLRVEIFDRRTAKRRTTDYLNWQSDLFIPDAYFTAPREVELERMDYSDYLKRSTEQGSVGPVPLFYLDLLYTRDGN